MAHIDDLTMMMYVDRELSEEESKEVALHIADCKQCKQASLFWFADQAFFQQSFTHSSPPGVLPELHPYVKEQIAAISALHKRKQHGFPWKWILIPAVILLILQIWLVGLFGQMSGVWDVVWESVFWIKENTTRWQLPFRNVFPAIIFFVILLIMLGVLNYRRTDYQKWEQPDGGIKK